MALSSLIRRLLPGALALGLLAGAGLAVTGCGDDDGSDVSKETFLREFSETSTLTDEINTCIVDELYANLTQEEINDFFGPQDEPLSDSNTAALTAASSKCTTDNLDIPEVPPASTEPTGTTAAG